MRYLFVTCLALLPTITLAANPDCAVFGGIVDRIVAERVEGTEMMAAMEVVAAEYTGEQARFAGTIPHLTDWVYNGLAEEHLTDEAGQAFAAQCAAQ
ncbi:hypothetical protein [Marinovum sp.]|uniref:hypothetical protein n=1 Tax=Marinovum sp. TaxID=2024839 RepID=UPI002B26C6AD|nr:hypothetical protein [Marinovum sp.]